MEEVRLLKVSTAKELTELVIEDCNIVLDYLEGKRDTCIPLIDGTIWDAYSAFLIDIDELFAHYKISKKVCDMVANQADELNNLFLAFYNENDAQCVTAFSKKFWKEYNNLMYIINANLYSIERKTME